MLKLSSGTLLRVLKRYGTPQALAADGEAAKLLARWGGEFLAPEKIEQLLTGAGASVGVRLGEWQQRQIQNYAQQALAARQEANRAERRLRSLAAGHAVLQAQRIRGLRPSPESSVIYNPEGKISQEKLENPAGFWNNVEENTFSLFQNKGAFE